MLGNLIERLNAQGEHILCIVRTLIFLRLQRTLIFLRFFLAQSCAVYSIYHHYVLGELGIFTLQKWCYQVDIDCLIDGWIQLSITLWE